MKQTIKAWAVINSGGEIMTKFDYSHNVFAPRIYKTAEGARNVARRLKTGGETGVVEVTISFSTPKK